MILTLRPATQRIAARPSCNFSPEVQQHYRAMLRQLGWPHSEGRPVPQVIGITACNSGQGTTTVACQLAATAAAMASNRVLIVDANVAHPGVARQFDVEASPGFVEIVLQGSLEGIAALGCDVSRLWILPTGSATQSGEQVYDSPALSGLVEELKNEFDLVVFDLPPAGAALAPLRLAELMDGVLLVVEADRGSWEDARRVRDFLSHSKVRLAGTVLNGYRG
jgi:protein-tyrosine kinase